MKDGIHPKYGVATVHCACGNVFETRSTKERIQVEICSSCHPFFTGKQKLIDTAGRIDRFKKKYGTRLTLGTQKKQKKAPAPPAPAKKLPLQAGTKSVKEKFQEARDKAATKNK